MRILDRYVIRSISKTAISTMAICTLLLLAVNLFQNLNSIVSGDRETGKILLLSFLGLPTYLMMAVSISFLFATTFFLSQLEANNERIILLNSGISPSRIYAPIFALSIVATAFFLIFSETILLKTTVAHDKLEEELFGRSSTRDNSNVTLKSMDGDYVIYASRYEEERKRVYDVVLVSTSDEGIEGRLEAGYGEYVDGIWVFHDVYMHTMDNDGGTIEPKRADERVEPGFDLDPRLFRNLSGEISTMDFKTATSYLRRLKAIDYTSYHEAATDFINRFFGPLSIFVLMMISCSMNYRFKKNVFLFSIIQSLSMAVVYYVANMVFSISSTQGLTEPILAAVMPIAVILAVTALFRCVFR